VHLPSRDAMQRLTKLLYLEIGHCPQLEESCTNQSSANSQWSNISHIPKIEVGGSIIQDRRKSLFLFHFPSRFLKYYFPRVPEKNLCMQFNTPTFSCNYFDIINANYQSIAYVLCFLQIAVLLILQVWYILIMIQS